MTIHENWGDRIVLLAAPWPAYNRPSIQIGALKAYLRRAMPDLTVDAFHLYLQIAARIGYRDYTAVSERSWLAEPVYAALLYPEKADSARAVFEKEARCKSTATGIDFKQLIQTVKVETDRFIAGIHWEDYLIAGFTVSLCQLTASLYLAREIKQRCPAIQIVAGGAGVAGESGRGLVAAFNWIDCAVQGEGEKPLVRLIKRIRSKRDRTGTFPKEAALPAVLTADDGAGRGIAFDQFGTLEEVPVPDYEDYFRLLKGLVPEKRFFPVLPVEISRGCWWQKRVKSGGRGCVFCNLNTQWAGYRTKPAAQVVSELERLKARYRLLSFAFMDNALPVKTSRDIFSAITAIGSAFSFFGEIRASTDFETLTAMRAAGLVRVQIGIEALSSRVLRKLNKGTTAIENLEIMKHCEELGIENRSNLIVQFPGTDAKDVARTLRAIDFAEIFRPLKPVRFWLGLGSPVCADAEAFGIKTHYNHPHYAALFPSEVCRKVPFVIQAYRGDRVKQAKLWGPVLRRIKAWEASYGELKRNHPGKPVLGYRDGGDFIIIRQRRSGRSPAVHRLAGTSREIYLYCRQRRGFSSIASAFPNFPQKQVRAFLDEMVQKRLMFTDVGEYLSLAVKVC